jgi:hypothetical protein
MTLKKNNKNFEEQLASFRLEPVPSDESLEESEEDVVANKKLAGDKEDSDDWGSDDNPSSDEDIDY